MNKMERINRKLMIILVVVFIIALSGRSIVNFVTDFLWFKNVDFLSIFTVKVKTKLFVFTPIFLLLAFGYRFYLNRLISNYSSLGKVIFTEQQKKLNGKFTLFTSIIIAAYFGFSITQTM